MVFNTKKTYAKKLRFGKIYWGERGHGWLDRCSHSRLMTISLIFVVRYARLCFVAIAPHFVCFRWSAKSWIMCYDNHTYMTHLDIRNNQIMSRTSNNKSVYLILLRYSISIWCFRLPFLSCSRIDIQTTKCPRLQHGE